MPQLDFFSWNVNGLRAVCKRGFGEVLAAHPADFYCFQEIKAKPENLAGVWEVPEGLHAYWNPAEKAGYSGTLVLSRVRAKRVLTSIGLPEADAEGRVVTLEFRNFYLVNVYVPNSQRGLTRLDFRTKSWEPAFRNWLKQLAKDKAVVVCGDFNVAHEEIDLARPKANHRNAGFTDEERSAFSELLASGFVDSFRVFESGGGHYSWWSYMNHAREKNIGWRIDYWLVSEERRKNLEASWILPEIMGSDHCPVQLTMKAGRGGLLA